MAEQQHDVVTRAQLLAMGFSASAIRHRLEKGRLHPLHAGVYAVGRPKVTPHGRWMAAVLACGSQAALSHESAAALYGIRKPRPGPVEVSIPDAVRVRRDGIWVHRRVSFERTTHERIPVTPPVCTLVDLATRLGRSPLEAAVNEADKRDLIDPDSLRAAVDDLHRHGAPALRAVLDRRTFALTASELERRFLALVRKAGLPKPETGARLNGFEVDFSWPELGLLVETDGLRYHRTPAEQARDRLRDQAHAAAGLTPLRFTHAQVRYEDAYVRATLRRVARRLAARGQK